MPRPSELAPDESNRTLVVLWIGVFLAGASVSLVMPFLPRFMAELGVTENLYTWSGLTYSAPFMTSVIMSPIWGNLADRIGRKPMMIRSGIGMAVITLLTSLATSPNQVFVLRVIQGVVAGFVPAASALIATTLPEHRVARGLAQVSSSMAAGTILGPMIGGALADLFSIRVTIQIASVLWVIAAVLVITLVKENPGSLSARRTSVIGDVRTAFSHRRMAAVLITATLVMASIQSLEPILTSFVPTLRQEAFLGGVVRGIFGRADAHAFVAGFIFSLPGLANVLFARRWSGVGQRIGFARLITFASLGAGLISMPQYFAGTAGTLIVLRFAYGTMTAAVQPLLGALLTTTVHPTFRGRAFGINTSMTQFGILVGPSLGGLVADRLGQRSVFVFAGVLLLVTSTWVYNALVRQSQSGALAGAPSTEPVVGSA